MDILENLVAYEADELELEEVVTLFQEMINSGVVWTLQGHYGRTASEFIETGLCTNANSNR